MSARKWHKPKERIPIVDPKLFKLGDFVSGSATINENLAELYNKPYELSVSQLTKNGYYDLDVLSASISVSSNFKCLVS